jgi:hypothetical protein
MSTPEQSNGDEFLDWADAQPQRTKFASKKKKRKIVIESATALESHAHYSAAVCTADAAANRPNSVLWSACDTVAFIASDRIALCDVNLLGTRRAVAARSTILCSKQTFRPHLGTSDPKFLKSNELHARYLLHAKRATNNSFSSACFSPHPFDLNSRFFQVHSFSVLANRADTFPRIQMCTGHIVA